MSHAPEIEKVPDLPSFAASFIAVDTLHHVDSELVYDRHNLSVIANGWICKHTSFEEARFIHWVWAVAGIIDMTGAIGR
jgi:hypothetical protein